MLNGRPGTHGYHGIRHRQQRAPYVYFSIGVWGLNMHTLKVLSRGRLIHAEHVETAELTQPPVFKFWAARTMDITDIMVTVDEGKLLGKNIGGPFRDVNCRIPVTKVKGPSTVQLDWCGRPMITFTKDGKEFHP